MVTSRGKMGLVTYTYGQGSLMMPFNTEIFLLECHVAGTTYIYNIEEISKNINIDDLIKLKREPDNEYDSLAILVLNVENEKIGYIPQSKNEVIARLMDAGKNIYAKIVTKQWFDNYLRIDIKIYFKDL